MPQPLLTVEDAAKRLNYSTRTIYEYIRTDPTFPARQTMKRGRWKIDPIKLEKWIENQMTYTGRREAEKEARRSRRGRPRVSDIR